MYDSEYRAPSSNEYHLVATAVFCTNAINIYAGINGLEAGQVSRSNSGLNELHTMTCICV